MMHNVEHTQVGGSRTAAKRGVMQSLLPSRWVAHLLSLLTLCSSPLSWLIRWSAARDAAWAAVSSAAQRVMSAAFMNQESCIQDNGGEVENARRACCRASVCVGTYAGLIL